MTYLITRRKIIFHGKRIQIWFDSRTDLTATYHCHIILEIYIIRSAHISLHVPVQRIHWHKSGSQERLIITDWINGCHNRILSSRPRKHSHFLRCIKSLSDFLLGRSRFIHQTITVSLLHCFCQQFLYKFCRYRPRIRSILTSLFFFEEYRLQIITQMFFYRFFSILLHVRVKSCVDFQSVSVDIIICPVLLFILCTPTV